MRLYEVVYIFDATLDEEGINKTLERVHEIVTQDGGEVVAVDHWGTRQLAYAIAKSNTGYYVVAQFKAGTEHLPEFERQLKLDDQIMRYLVVLNEGEPTTGLSILAPQNPFRREDAPRAHDDGDDDEPRPQDEGRGEELSDGEGPPEFSGGQGRRRRMEGPRVELLNFKDVSTLSRFMTEQGKILPRRTTKVTAGFQRQLGRAIKRARYLGLIPYVRDHEG